MEKVDLEKLQASRAADYKGMEDHVAMNEAVYEEQYGTEEEIYQAAKKTAAEYLENFDAAMEEEEQWRRNQQAQAAGAKEAAKARGQRDLQKEDDDRDGDEWDDAGAPSDVVFVWGL